MDMVQAVITGRRKKEKGTHQLVVEVKISERMIRYNNPWWLYLKKFMKGYEERFIGLVCNDDTYNGYRDCKRFCTVKICVCVK